jgi:hypothetical protein
MMERFDFTPYRVVAILSRERLPAARILRSFAGDHAKLRFLQSFVSFASGDLASAQEVSGWALSLLDALALAGASHRGGGAGERVRVGYFSANRPVTSFMFPARLCEVLGTWGISAMASTRDSKAGPTRPPKPPPTDVFAAGHFLVALRVRHTVGASQDVLRAETLGTVRRVHEDGFNLRLPRCRSIAEVADVVLDVLDRWRAAPPVSDDAGIHGELDIGYLVPYPVTSADIEVGPRLLQAVGRFGWNLRISEYLTATSDGACSEGLAHPSISARHP